MLPQLKQVLTFHRLAGDTPLPHPTANIPEKTKQLRIRLIKEETAELIEAIETKNLQEIAKELADVLYVLLGTVVAFGLQNVFHKVFTAVHKSNLSKFRHKNREAVLDAQGKVLKGSQFKPADLTLLEEPD